MSHWAEVKEIDGQLIVQRVLVGNNNEPDEGEAFMNSLGGTWVKTSFSGSIRKNFAGPGYIYDPVRDAFLTPKITCHETVTLDEETCRWKCLDSSHTETGVE
ncbi:hypothetical protein UFOVP655_85 [uncultured Caudovirales phage]|uniref:Uncharacterized protein n=1 Tax=uncultured Caudovirales phage TaxID=2100421 RepID=A0A6J5NCS9_9CAUD|nr:hypothetical protein UFOVP655_85 [uncultured Caudovirales phage]